MNINYIKDHIDRIQQTNDQNLIDNSLWRIASNAELFDNLNNDGSLSLDQKEKIQAFIDSL